jgi:hypothetical protein
LTGSFHGVEAILVNLTSHFVWGYGLLFADFYHGQLKPNLCMSDIMVNLLHFPVMVL